MIAVVRKDPLRCRSGITVTIQIIGETGVVEMEVGEMGVILTNTCG